ncbi:hypothetical protein FRC07_000643 [Ceratobasidium sp. 392]|nr:hypothetical protein FRC07_000643 [Ceratobasidium sp. 392]
MDGARTPTTDLSLGRRMSGGGIGIGIGGGGSGGREFGGGGGGIGGGGLGGGGRGEEEERERDDSGIDMFEADDGDLREEARSNRKIADLEISNKSLLAINATLESTKARQAKEIRDLRRKLRESRLVLPHHTFVALEKSDPLAPESGSVEDEEDSDENEGDVTQTQADETFARVKLLLDGLIVNAKEALETGPTRISDKAGIGGPSIRVLNVHDVEDDYTTGRSEAETDDADDADDVGESEDEIESIDGVSPLSETPPVPISTGGAFSGLRSSLGRWM